MTKGKKIILITSIILVVIVGVLMLSKKLRLILGLDVKFKSDADGQTYTLKLGSYGTKSSRIISIYQDDILQGQIFRDGEIIKWVRNSGTITPITNEKDSKFFKSIL